MLGRLARRGLAGCSGGKRLGRSGILLSGLPLPEGMVRLNGACEPRALERDTWGLGAEVDR